MVIHNLTKFTPFNYLIIYCLDCTSTSKGTEYMGTVSTTNTGIPCQVTAN